MLGTGMPGPIDGSGTPGISFLSWSTPAPKAPPFVPSRREGGHVFGPEDPRVRLLRFSLMRRLRIASKVAILVTLDRISSCSARSPVCSMIAIRSKKVLCVLLTIGNGFWTSGELPKPSRPDQG
jgi:hypothetical protein